MSVSIRTASLVAPSMELLIKLHFTLLFTTRNKVVIQTNCKLVKVAAMLAVCFLFSDKAQPTNLLKRHMPYYLKSKAVKTAMTSCHRITSQSTQTSSNLESHRYENGRLPLLLIVSLWMQAATDEMSTNLETFPLLAAMPAKISVALKLTNCNKFIVRGFSWCRQPQPYGWCYTQLS